MAERCKHCGEQITEFGDSTYGFYHEATGEQGCKLKAAPATTQPAELSVEDARWEQAENRVAKYMEGYIKGQQDRAIDWCPMIEQFCKDLNSAHNELLRAQGVTEADFGKWDWPEWSPQANSIRWAENLLKKKLAKTEHWTLYPTAKEQHG